MKKLAAALLAVFLAAFVSVYVYGATTLLPNGMQCFSTVNGPVVGGQVYMYFPGGTVTKQTWQDSGQVTLNSQPIILDANGCATIYGVGSYRQVLQDANSVQIWDKITTDTSAFNSLFWAGLSGGTPNSITITYPGFNATNGTQVNFVALSSNTGSATLNPSAFGAISIVKDTTAGPVALVGGEITANNIISVVYYTTDNHFHLLNPAAASASGSTSPLCGFNGLSIVNDNSTPNTIMDITASQAVMLDNSSLPVNSSNISVTLNISLGTGGTSTAGGMDGSPPGTSAWIYVYTINNGSTTSALGSLSATAPTLPSGYTYKCRAGAFRIDGSGNFYRVTAKGNYTQYNVVAATNSTTYPTPTSGASGTCGVGTYTQIGLTAWVPPTAPRVAALATNYYNGGTLSSVCVAPSNTFGAGNGTNPPPFSIESTSRSGIPFILTLTNSQSLFYASSASGGALLVIGYFDAVNAN